jgi:hypothetical protein
MQLLRANYRLNDDASYLQECAKDLHQAVLAREVDRKCRKQALQAWIYGKAPCCGVHTRHILGAVDILLRQLGPVVPMAPAKVLPDQANRHCSLICIQLGHVQIVNKVDQLLGARRAVVNPRLLFKRRFQHLYTHDNCSTGVYMPVYECAAVGAGFAASGGLTAQRQLRTFWNDATSVK